MVTGHGDEPRREASGVEIETASRPSPMLRRVLERLVAVEAHLPDGGVDDALPVGDEASDAHGTVIRGSSPSSGRRGASGGVVRFAGKDHAAERVEIHG